MFGAEPQHLIARLQAISPKMIHLVLKQIRADRDLSIRALGKYSKVSHSTISRFERGKGSITIAQLQRICTTLGCTIEIN